MEHLARESLLLRLAFAVPVNVLPLDLHPQVTVGPALFVPKAQGMGHLMRNYAQL